MNILAAIDYLRPNSPYTLLSPDYDSLIWQDENNPKPTLAEINQAIELLTQQAPLKELRRLRNQKLAESDWMAVSDRVMTQAQIDYRQALRDLPQTADPQLDEQGNLTNVTWPEL